MPDQLQLRGGTTAEHSTFTGAIKEVTVDTTKKTAVVHDGTTAGGIALLRQDGSNSALALGSEGTPSLKWDANTGIFSPGDDQLAIVTGGNRAITCTSTQAVGIKTANPNAALHVAGSARVGADSAADAILEIGEGATGNRNSYIDIVADTTYTDYGLRVIRNNTGANATSELKHRGTGALNITTQEAAPIEFYTTNSPRVAIDSSGRLLVGTSSSRSTYNAGDAPKFQVESTTAGATVGITLSTDNTNSSELYLAKARGSAVNSHTIVQNNDNLGILFFGGADGTNIIRAASVGAQVDGTPGANDMPGRLVFSTTADGASSPTERMRIGQNGGVAIGNTDTAAGYKLKITGSNDVFLGGWGAGIGTAMVLETAVATTSTALSFNYLTTEVGKITTTSTSTAYVTSSDYRLKENVVSVTDGITRLRQLKPSRFNFIADPDRTVDGFIAHEVQTVVPEAIVGEKDAVDDEGNPKYQGIDQSKLVPLLTAALQEAIGEIESLKARLTAAGL